MSGDVGDTATRVMTAETEYSAAVRGDGQTVRLVVAEELAHQAVPGAGDVVGLVRVAVEELPEVEKEPPGLHQTVEPGADLGGPG